MSFFKRKADAEPANDWQSLLFARDREELASQLQTMADAAVSMVKNAMAALQKRDEQLARQVINSDGTVDDLEISIENLCLRALAMRQPVREDLRFVFSVLKTITDLERIGDQAVNIAQRTLKIHGPFIKPLVDLPRMGQLAEEMVRHAVDSLIHENAPEAQEVIEGDDAVDDLNDRIYDDLIEMMRRHHEDDQLVDQATQLIITSRNLERIGDHACNIAERAWYTVTGERFQLEHHRRGIPEPPDGADGQPS
ncbi:MULTISPECIES: phosphate signaling complex protein PhoU [Jonquetella]|uniref:Phosphate-specific transport system accessory protein PhoU n=1 Tax=Jonquetella anthropi DSM 22815 TaxID=885272 RepID=H0UIP5_9BACT|nr:MULTISPECIES: phosphate signaling complex protein PhoU [Jonquetella]EEX49341.1 phosphate transport system regulatory protein PhoU [Jonquetella anthropi E3_33 E1]EHM13790.1 phosphate transport system regulatory protein PhoU [Jonquetella anthropi DSM 22815]ERL24291.1 phosphate transport system regulatory protein PhoU [Jonquetella sp. BV3C21]